MTAIAPQKVLMKLYSVELVRILHATTEQLTKQQLSGC